MSAPRIAVLGAGLVGARHVAEAAAQARLAAIVDPSPEAAALAARHNVPHFTDVARCLEEVTPDGAVIATPNHLHADHAEACLARRIPVLVEKPIADSLENADRIVAASHAAGTPVLTGHHRRHNPIIARAREIIAAGELGEIVAVTGQFWLYKPPDYFAAAPWRSQPGGGPLLINCIHDIDLLRHLVGEITEVQAMQAATQRHSAVEDTAAVLFRFENGALGTFSVSDTIAAPWSWELTAGENPIYPRTGEAAYRIGGTKASLSIPDLTLWRHDGPRSWWEPISAENHAVTEEDAFANQFRHFLKVIAGAAPMVDARDARASLAVIKACIG